MREALVDIGSVLLGYNLLAGHLREKTKYKKEKKNMRDGNYFWILCYFSLHDNIFLGYNDYEIIKGLQKGIIFFIKQQEEEFESFVFSLFCFSYGCWDFYFYFYGLFFLPWVSTSGFLRLSRLGFCLLFFSILGFFDFLGSVDYSTE